MVDVKRETEQFIERLKQSEVYQCFVEQCHRIEAHPDLAKKIDEFRERNFRLQNEMDSDALFDETDRFEKEYAEFRKNPIVNDYLEAELDYCRMFQEVSESISTAFASQM